jgi:hypothetical protein
MVGKFVVEKKKQTIYHWAEPLTPRKFLTFRGARTEYTNAEYQSPSI